MFHYNNQILIYIYCAVVCNVSSSKIRIEEKSYIVCQSDEQLAPV